MIKLTALLVLLAWTAASAISAQGPYAPPEADFSIAFPAAPTVQSRPAHRSHDVAYRRYVDQEPSRALIVAIDDYPEGSLPPSPDGGVYDKLLRNRAADDQAQLMSTKPARLSGHPSLEGTLVDMNGNVEVVRVLMLGDRLYQLTYVHPDGADPAGADAAFFSSFRITPPATP